jgi:hypothetical protein
VEPLRISLLFLQMLVLLSKKKAARRTAAIIFVTSRIELGSVCSLLR